MRKIFENTRLLGLLRAAYYRYWLKVTWTPAYNIMTKHYVVKLNGIEMKFTTSPFFDVQYALTDYIASLPIGNSKVFLDAGSFIGTFTIYVALLVENSQVVAVEPDTHNRKLLVENIRINNLTNVIVCDKGLWNKKTTLKFAADDGEMSGFETSGNSSDNVILVKTTTIDGLSKKYKADFDYIKMDIEGAEIEALQGSIALIRRVKTRFVVASYHMREGEMTKKRVEDFFSTYYKNIYSTNNGQLLSIATND